MKSLWVNFIDIAVDSWFPGIILGILGIVWFFKTKFTSSHHVQIPKQVKVISFDLDFTLWDVKPILQRSNLKMRQKLQEFPEGKQFIRNYSDEQFEKVLREVIAQHIHLPTTLWNDYKTWYRLGLEKCGVPGNVAIAAMESWEKGRNDVDFALCPFVQETLERLSEKYTLVTCSNGNTDITASRIGKYFSHIVNARLANAKKPASKIFQHISNITQCEPSEILHIGDCLKGDVIGSFNAGFHCLWKTREFFNVDANTWQLGEHKSLNRKLRENSRYLGRLDSFRDLIF